jgi:uncharacterized membrane protein
MRIRQIDALRGFAIVLMVADHCALFFDMPYFFRLPGRLAMPIFMMISGYLWRSGLTGERYLQVIAAAFFTTFVGWKLGFPLPDILVSWLLWQPLMKYIVRFPVLAAAYGLVISQLFVVGAGYHPGLILAFLSLGVVLRRWPLFPLAWVNLPVPLKYVGLRPISAYVGHFALLYSLFLLR